jgi:hypothetical protein
VTDRVVALGACLAAGAFPGWLLGGTGGTILGVVVGGVIGVLAAHFQVRVAVAAAVTAGAVIGALIGSNVVEVICRPGSCVGLEMATAVLTGVGAFVGVGIIAALATRSFEEYREGRGGE